MYMAGDDEKDFNAFMFLLGISFITSKSAWRGRGRGENSIHTIRSSLAVVLVR
jgi:hypothetical protein